jgi:hypothetical protein
MITIFKYTLSPPNPIVLWMPQDAQILYTLGQRGEIVVYAKVNTALPSSARILAVFGTGHDIPTDFDMRIISTLGIAQIGALVFHVFELSHTALTTS